MNNNQKEKLFSNKFIQEFLDNQSSLSLKKNYKLIEIASSLAHYLKTFSLADIIKLSASLLESANSSR